MKATIAAAVLAALSSTVSALPKKARDSTSPPFTVTSLASGTAAHFLPLNVNDKFFYLGGKQSNYTCNAGVSSCGPEDQDVVLTVDLNEDTMSVDSSVPGGQGAYIRADGALMFTEAHYEGVYPNGSLTVGFDYVQSAEYYNLGFTQASAGGKSIPWFACPTQDPTAYDYAFQVFAELEGLSFGTECIEVTLETETYTEGSEVYTYQ